ncbi:MAG: deoxyribose-phosphate aldolase [Fenollaria massiliensis]|uniref:Deoxyribose-phosphate aldolase n=1 Tax=Anaerococcus degeneri TaxID=361500 RepID=A0ABS7YX94_9FIRM|nr:deoxyribose-phosphate aldolase [Anaerococcus degeneri]MBP2016335.1 deoxyribose-phosphate aldolase [Anaerococcus degeneri]MCA2096355.1 deoxyribose-phosphate aldolase [Anaerococcus degeneri]
MEINKYFDHTILKPDARKEDVIKICKEAIDYKFKSVCVNSSFAKLVKKELEGSGVDLTIVVGFPLGAMSTEAKEFETKYAVENGADEIDMVINISALKDENYDYLEEEIRRLKEICGSKILKVIIETCLLTDDEKVRACQIAKKAGADFVKTSTGFSTGGAKVEDVRLMRKTVGDDMGVKASGGIRTLEDVKKFVEAGASRIGASASVQIMEELNNK